MRTRRTGWYQWTKNDAAAAAAAAAAAEGIVLGIALADAPFEPQRLPPPGSPAGTPS